jgi:hypothetical protein
MMEVTVGLVTLALVVTTWALGRLVSHLQHPERDLERHS